jgi:hypothetical protein
VSDTNGLRHLFIQFFEALPTGMVDAFHFCFALTRKGVTITALMRLELKSFCGSEWLKYSEELV